MSKKDTLSKKPRQESKKDTLSKKPRQESKKGTLLRNLTTSVKSTLSRIYIKYLKTSS